MTSRTNGDEERLPDSQGGGDPAGPPTAQHQDGASQHAIQDGVDVATEFAPAEPTDGREVGEWQSRYADKQARRRIRAEAFYVTASLIGYPILMLLVALQFQRETLGITIEDWNNLSPFVLAFLGGALGGTLFSTKWLYHTVARGTWHVDRWLWRVFTPMLSAGAAEAIILLSAGRIIPLFGADLVRTNAGALGVAILVGYFSDRTFSRLERLAEQHLGSTRSQVRDDDDSSSGEK